MGAQVSLGIVAAKGDIVTEILRCMEKTKFPVYDMFIYSDEKTFIGEVKDTPCGKKKVKEFSVDAVSLNGCGIVIVSISDLFSERFCPLLANLRIVVIDMSSSFRNDPRSPLIVPEVNGHILGGIETGMIISSPNCTSAIAAIVLGPIAEQYGLRSVIISSYQAASGRGERGIQQLRQELASQPVTDKVFAHTLLCNVIPLIDTVVDNDYSLEEMKLSWELQKIFRDEKVTVSATCVRVPTERAHAMSITIETRRPVKAADVRHLLKTSAGISLMDEPKKDIYPMPINATEQLDVCVGRIRQSLVFKEKGIDLFVCGDQMLRGGALNAVNIAHRLVIENRK